MDAGENLPHPRITIKIKSIPLPAGEVASESNPQCFYVPNEADDNAPPPFCRKLSVGRRKPSPSDAFTDPLALPPDTQQSRDVTVCDVCRQAGGATTAVK